MQVEAVFVCQDEIISNRLAGDAGRDRDGICFGILAVCGGHLERSGLRQGSGLAVCGLVIGTDKFGLSCALTEEGEVILEQAVLNRIALDGAGDGAVREARRLGRSSQCLPAQLEVEVNAGLQTQNEGELDVGFDGFALLVFLRGRGLHDEDIVLVFRAVGQGHGHSTAGVDLAGDGVAGSKKRAGDDGVLCVKAGEVEAVRQGSVVELREQNTLADGLTGGADDGSRL